MRDVSIIINEHNNDGIIKPANTFEYAILSAGFQARFPYSLQAIFAVVKPIHTAIHFIFEIIYALCAIFTTIMTIDFINKY